MDKIYQKAKDKNVAAVKVYYDSNNYAYLDAAKTVKPTAKELEEVFIKGCLIVLDTGYTIPVVYSAPNPDEMVEYAALSGGEDVTIYSKEYVPSPPVIG